MGIYLVYRKGSLHYAAGVCFVLLAPEPVLLALYLRRAICFLVSMMNWTVGWRTMLFSTYSSQIPRLFFHVCELILCNMACTQEYWPGVQHFLGRQILYSQ